MYVQIEGENRSKTGEHNVRFNIMLCLVTTFIYNSLVDPIPGSNKMSWK